MTAEPATLPASREEDPPELPARALEDVHLRSTFPPVTENAIEKT